MDVSSAGHGGGPGGRLPSALQGCPASREPDRDMGKVCAMVAGVKGLGLETCMTLRHAGGGGGA
jgi:hypothetical protein